MRTCAHCGRSIAGKRANARFCSTSCRVMAGRNNPIPAVMRGSDRWVSWRPVQRGDKWTKLPTQVGGRPASSTDPRTWTSWLEVRDLPRRGWVLGEGIGCIDLDDCIDGDGAVAPWLSRLFVRSARTRFSLRFPRRVGAFTCLRRCLLDVAVWSASAGVVLRFILPILAGTSV